MSLKVTFSRDNLDVNEQMWLIWGLRGKKLYRGQADCKRPVSKGRPSTSAVRYRAACTSKYCVVGNTANCNFPQNRMKHTVWPIKQSHYRPGQALRVPGGWGSLISRQSAHEDVKFDSPTQRPPLPPPPPPPQKIFLVLISFRGWINPRVTVRPEGLCHWKIPMRPSEIEPKTLRLVTARSIRSFIIAVMHRYCQTDLHLGRQSLIIYGDIWMGSINSKQFLRGAEDGIFHQNSLT